MSLTVERPAAPARVEARVAWPDFGERVRAEAEPTSARAQARGCPQARVGLARLRVRSGRLVEALDLLAGALEQDPTDPDAHLLLAVCRAQLGHSSGAGSALSRALELVLTLPPSFLVPWDPARRAAAVAADVGALRAAVAERPGFADRRVDLAVKLLLSGGSREAMVELEAALELNPDYLEARLLAGRAGLESGRPESAFLHLERALAAHPEYPDLHFWWGLAGARARRFPESAAALERALRSNRHFARAHRLLASVYHALGRPRDALRAARCGFVREADAVRGIRPRRGSGSWDGLDSAGPFEPSAPGEAALMAAIELHPGYPDLRLALARLRRARGGFARAHDACRRALALHPDYPEALLELARIELALGRAQRAVPLLRQVVVDRPRWGDARALLGGACHTPPQGPGWTHAPGRPS